MNAELPIPKCWRLTFREVQVLRALYAARDKLTKNELMDLLYADAWRQPGPKIIDVWVCKLRTKLARHMRATEAPIILTLWGRGYLIEAEAKARLYQQSIADTASETLGMAA